MKTASWKSLVLMVLLYLMFPSKIAMEVFTSTAELYDLHEEERQLTISLNEYVQSSVNDLSRMKVLLKNFRELAKLMTTKQYKGEAVLFYVFLERIMGHSNKLSQILDDRRRKRSVVYYVTDFFRKTLLNHGPRLANYELHGAADALIRLQSIYNLNVTELSEGHLSREVSRGLHTIGARLGALDTYLLGRVAYSRGNMNSAAAWMLETTRLLGTQDTLVGLAESVQLSDVLNHLAYAYYSQGQWNRSLAIYRQLAAKEPNNALFQDNLKRIRDKIHSSQSIRRQADATDEEEMVEYFNLCQAHSVADYEQRHASLTCEYFKDHAKLLLKPVAMERLSIRPFIVQFHNVLSGREMEEIIKLATPKLTRAGVNNLETGQMEVVDYRISKTAWLSDQAGDVVKRLSQRIEALTGLSISTAEDLQVSNYGLAGHYEPHYDFAVNINNSPLAELGTGNRMATLMFYLSDVEAGGDTVFINPGIRVAPKKGSALFWYNLMPSGRGDWDTLHAGCPVIAGSKWVANKWFHEYGQEFRRPCGTEEDA